MPLPLYGCLQRLVHAHPSHSCPRPRSPALQSVLLQEMAAGGCSPLRDFIIWLDRNAPAATPTTEPRASVAAGAAQAADAPIAAMAPVRSPTSAPLSFSATIQRVQQSFGLHIVCSPAGVVVEDSTDCSYATRSCAVLVPTRSLLTRLLGSLRPIAWRPFRATASTRCIRRTGQPGRSQVTSSLPSMVPVFCNPAMASTPTWFLTKSQG